MLKEDALFIFNMDDYLEYQVSDYDMKFQRFFRDRPGHMDM
jgi:hypothetical protein